MTRHESSEHSVVIGTKLSHYRILDRLGAGGMGVVFRARDERLGRDVAVKILHAGAVADPESRRRFRREALALSRLNHPGVAAIHEFDTQDGVDFLVMEYLVGDSLEARMRSGPLPEPDILAWGIAIAEALQAAHDQQVIHRDLKPGNVIITESGGLKVLDFGMAKLDSTMSLAQSEQLSSMQPAGGTLRYMAPERVLGHDVDGRADLYSLGVVLYQMATGRTPFDSEAPAVLCMQILKQRPRPPRALNPNISHRLEWVIWKLLQKDPVRRYPDAAAVVRELKGAAVPMPPLERAGLAFRVHRPAWIRLAAATAVVATLTVVGFANRDRVPEQLGGKPRIRSIAVLPFTNISGDSTQDFLAEGLTEELIANLAQIPSLRVISRTSTMRYKLAPKPMPVIGRELNVDAIVEGSIGRVGDQLRVTTQLVRAATDEHLWARSYDRAATDLASLRTDVALAIVGEIQAKVSPSKRAELARPRPIDPSAYDSYLKGRHFRDRIQEPDVRKGIEYFEDAIRRQPDFAGAYAEQADCYLQLALNNGMPAEAAYERAKQLAYRAIEIDSTLVEAHVMLARLLMIADWKFQESESHLKAALSMNPGTAVAHRAMASYLAVMGRAEEALVYSRRARDIDPLSIRSNQSLATILGMTGRYDESIRQAYRTLELDSTWLDVHYSLMVAYHAKGMIPETIAEQLIIYDGLSAIGFISAEPGTIAALRVAYAKGGAEAFWRADIERMRDGYGQINPCAIATIYCYLGDRDHAMEWLEKAYAKHYQAILYIKADPDFAILRGDPRFDNLLRRIGISS